MLPWLALGCGEPTPPPPAPAPAPVVVSAPVPVEPRADGTTDGLVPVELQFEGVGDLHRRWFSDRAIVTALSEGLAPCVRDRAVVRMAWDEPTFTGTIRLYVDRASLACNPPRGESVDLGAIEPIGRALAAYRDAVANTFDLRVSSFRIELEALDGTQLCRLTLGGQFPPDGTSWAPCADLGGRTVCAGDARPGAREPGVRLLSFADPADTVYVGRCLGR